MEDVGHGISSYLLNNTHDRLTSGMACHHCHWTAHTDRRCQAWHAIIPYGKHTRSDKVGLGMQLWRLDSTKDRTMSGVAFHHSSKIVHTIGRHWMWPAIIAIGQNTRSDDVKRGMPLCPLERTHNRMTSSEACPLNRWTAHAVRRHRTSHPIMALG